jgi:hypothetical protein
VPSDPAILSDVMLLTLNAVVQRSVLATCARPRALRVIGSIFESYWEDLLDTNSSSNTLTTRAFHQASYQSQKASASALEMSSRGRGRGRGGAAGGEGGGSSKLRGHPRDSPDVQLSKTLSYLLRHGAEKEKLPIRADGFVSVRDLVS